MPILVPHSPAWAAEFEKLRRVYAAVLGGLILRIEHVGSTAVPGLAAKPILDIDIVMPGYEVFPAITAALAELGYAHNGDQRIPQREAFKERDATVPYTQPRRTWMNHHLYVCPEAGAELRRHVAFRDALRARADLRQEYERLKFAIAARCGDDRKLYASIKDIECRDFVTRVIGSV